MRGPTSDEESSSEGVTAFKPRPNGAMRHVPPPAEPAQCPVGTPAMAPTDVTCGLGLLSWISQGDAVFEPLGEHVPEVACSNS
jgi:hypothetical protein